MRERGERKLRCTNRGSKHRPRPPLHSFHACTDFWIRGGAVAKSDCACISLCPLSLFSSSVLHPASEIGCHSSLRGLLLLSSCSWQLVPVSPDSTPHKPVRVAFGSFSYCMFILQLKSAGIGSERINKYVAFMSV